MQALECDVFREQGRDAEIFRVNYLWLGTCLCVTLSENYRVNNLVVLVEYRQHQPDRTGRYGV